MLSSDTDLTVRRTRHSPRCTHSLRPSEPSRAGPTRRDSIEHDWTGRGDRRNDLLHDSTQQAETAWTALHWTATGSGPSLSVAIGSDEDSDSEAVARKDTQL